MTSSSDLPQAEEREGGGGEISGLFIAVPDGEYELRYGSYETGIYWNSPKVVVHCWISSPEKYEGFPVDRFYNVRHLGPPCRYGNYDAPARGHLVREYARLIGEPDRLDRISWVVLKDKRLIGELETVTTDDRGDLLPVCCQYSRVARFLRVLPDDD